MAKHKIGLTVDSSGKLKLSDNDSTSAGLWGTIIWKIDDTDKIASFRIIGDPNNKVQNIFYDDLPTKEVKILTEKVSATHWPWNKDLIWNYKIVWTEKGSNNSYTWDPKIAVKPTIPFPFAILISLLLVVIPTLSFFRSKKIYL